MLEKSPTEPLILPSELAQIVDGEWTCQPIRHIRHIRTDLELTEPGLEDFLLVPELFYRGKSIGRDNALQSCLEAWRKGACGFIVSEVPRNVADTVPCLIVENAFDAIARLAEHRRRTSNARFVAVTGSAGKTTTKEMIATLLSSDGEVARSIFNYNCDRPSLYFTLSNVSDAHRYCSAEFSGVGDIELQGEIYRPDVAVITNVLWEHAERFEKKGLSGGDVIDAIIERKTSLIRNLVRGGHAVLNRDNEHFLKQCRAFEDRPDINLLTFGKHEAADIRLLDCQLHPDSSTIRASVMGKEYRYELAIPGEHMAINSLAGLAVVSALDVDVGRALEEIALLRPGFRRGEVYHVPWKNGTITAINDTVSSSVPATNALLKTVSNRDLPSGGRRIVILGDIGELGSRLFEQMDELAQEAATYPIDRFYTIGAGIRIFNQTFPDRARMAPHAGSLDQIYRLLQAELEPGDVVAFKGSMVQGGFSLRRLWSLLVEPGSPQAAASSDLDLPTDKFRVVIGGDTYLGEQYQKLRNRNGEINYLESFGYTYSGERLKPLFERADCAVLNLECALTEMQTSPLNGKKDYILGGSPDDTIHALEDLSINAVLLGNNHVMDYGAEGLRDTLNALDQTGIAAIGAGSDKQSSQQPFICAHSRAGVEFKLAVISAYQYNHTYESEFQFYSGKNRWGVNNIHTGRLRDQIADLKDQGYYVVVSPHWGQNYCFRGFDQQRLARDMFYQCRADLIIGHGPHMYNEFGKIGDNWVFYSIGNLIFNSEGEYARRQLPPYSFVTELVADLFDDGYQLALNVYPIVSCNQMTQFQPDFLDDAEFERFTGMLKAQNYDPFFFDENIRILNEDGRNYYQINLV